MGQVSDKLRRIDGRSYKGFAHWCPACEEIHVFATEGKNWNGDSWTFDGDVNCPTFAPSMCITVNPKTDPHHDPEEPTEVCHYFLQHGYIQYLADCTHVLKNQRIVLPNLPDHLTELRPHVRRVKNGGREDA